VKELWSTAGSSPKEIEEILADDDWARPRSFVDRRRQASDMPLALT